MTSFFITCAGYRPTFFGNGARAGCFPGAVPQKAPKKEKPRPLSGNRAFEPDEFRLLQLKIIHLEVGRSKGGGTGARIELDTHPIDIGCVFIGSRESWGEGQVGPSSRRQ